MRLTTLRRIRSIQESLKLLWESDEKRIRRKYRGELGRDPNLDVPATYTEKVLWLNLRHRDPRQVICADKYEVRRWVAERVGEDILVPLLGVYDDADDIDFESLPAAFVIKATHGSGWNLIVPDKSALDRVEARRSLQDWLVAELLRAQAGMAVQGHASPTRRREVPGGSKTAGSHPSSSSSVFDTATSRRSWSGRLR